MGNRHSSLVNRQFLALLCLMVSGCATASGTASLSGRSTSALTMSLVGVEPKRVDVGRGNVATIHYELSRPATVIVDLMDEDGQRIRRIEAGRQHTGAHQIVWDGRMADGSQVSNGAYRYVIRASGDHGVEVTYDPAQDIGGEMLEPRAFTWDPDTSVFRWIMPQAGRARLRVGLEGLPHLRTLLDWEPLEGGVQTFTWNGMDSSGLIKLRDHPGLSVKLDVFAFAPNVVIVKGSATDSVATTDQPAFLATRRQTLAFHARHARSHCHEVQLRVEFPDHPAIDVDGRPILQGVVPVRIMLNEREASYLINQRFEVAFFEDLTSIFEEEESSNPFTYLWDTSHLPPGPHLLTVNVLSYDDHFGVVTQPVIIRGSG